MEEDTVQDKSRNLYKKMEAEYNLKKIYGEILKNFEKIIFKLWN